MRPAATFLREASAVASLLISPRAKRPASPWKLISCAFLAGSFLAGISPPSAGKRASPSAAQKPSLPPAIRGSLVRASGAPIAGAQVILQSLDSEDCARLFNKKGQKSPEDAAKLSKCVHDLFTLESNAKGEFSFAGVQPGWYDVRFLWNIEPKPGKSPSADTIGDFLVLYAGHKDVTGRFDTLSQGDAFLFDAARDYSISFKY